MANALNINTADLSNQIGALPTIFGRITYDLPFKRANGDEGVAIYIRVGLGWPDVAGDLIIEDQDGVVDVIRAVSTGEYVPIAKARRVIENATIGGTPYTTTCTNLTWFGGAR